MGQQIEVQPEIALGTGSLKLSLPESLGRLVEDQTEGFCGENGYETRPGLWKPPANITNADRENARSCIAQAEAVCKPAQPDAVRKWISTLGALVAGNMPVEDARAKLSAYTRLLEIPLGVVGDDDTLKRAGRRFKWFPAYAELAEFVDQERSRLDRRATRLRIIANGDEDTKPAKPRFWPPVRKFTDAEPKTAVETVIEEDTSAMTPDQRLAYWGARIEGKEPAVARDIATGTQVQEPA